mmetsp:Transcript_20277/g.51871  ORF Transcript_20277/g.51871 Transcript_20277/m.51871 type:complete len:170 (+) Transcript_20277:170-679(+)
MGKIANIGITLLCVICATMAVPVVHDMQKKEELKSKRSVFQPRINFDDTISVSVGDHTCVLHYRAYGSADEEWSLSITQSRRGGAFCSLFRVSIEEKREGLGGDTSGLLWQGFAAYVERKDKKQLLRSIEVYDAEGLLLQDDDYTVEEGAELRNYPGWSKQLEQFTIEV